MLVRKKAPQFFAQFHALFPYTPYFLWEQGTGLERINWDNCVLLGCRSRIPPLFISLFHLAFLFCVRNGEKSSTPFLPRHRWLRPNFLWAFYLDPKFFCEQENRHISQAATSLFRAAFKREAGEMKIIAFYVDAAAGFLPSLFHSRIPLSNGHFGLKSHQATWNLIEVRQDCDPSSLGWLWKNAAGPEAAGNSGFDPMEKGELKYTWY